MLTRVLAALLCASVPALASCTTPAAATYVATQNLANVESLAANTSALAPLTLAQAASLGEVRMHDARQRTAVALARVHSAQNAELTERIAALRIELAGAPAPHREAVLAALAAREPALIDIAGGDPNFSSERVLEDAAALDDLHERLDAERDPALRAAIHAQRNAVLAPYALVRSASAIAVADIAAMNDLRAALDEQSRIALLHARSLADFTDPSAAPAPAAADLYRSAELRNLLLDTVERSRGRDARDRVSGWLARADAALDVFGGPAFGGPALQSGVPH